MMDIKTIGVAVDGSAATDQVLEMAALQAKLDGVERIVVACALPSAVAVADGVVNFPASAVDRMAATGKEVLAKAERRLADVPCAVETYLLRGRDTAETLSSFFDEQRCDLIVVGNRGLGGVKGYMGSVSRKVLLHAGCPVVVIKVD